MEKNIGEYLSRKSTEVIAIVACIGLIITIILAAGSIRTEQEKMPRRAASPSLIILPTLR